jgi:ABC-type bacteriocin/lantibiotic exporter with double-glycine peptidase domain
MNHLYEAIMGNSDHSSGFVKFDGDLIEDLDISKIRNYIQIVAHDQFFSGTVRENLIGLGGDKDFTETEIQNVLMRAGLFENIEALPEKLETKIRPNGFPFTKSQLLALQIARALLLQPRILFVTPDYEQISTYKRKLIYEELLSQESKWTLLFFTQRYYKGNFDRMVVLERSSLKELASENELLKEIENDG